MGEKLNHNLALSRSRGGDRERRRHDREGTSILGVSLPNSGDIRRYRKKNSNGSIEWKGSVIGRLLKAEFTPLRRLFTFEEVKLSEASVATQGRRYFASSAEKERAKPIWFSHNASRLPPIRAPSTPPIISHAPQHLLSNPASNLPSQQMHQ